LPVFPLVATCRVGNTKDWEWGSYPVYVEGADNALIDLMPSFLGLCANRLHCIAHLRELVEGEVVKDDESWTKNYVIGSEGFVKKYRHELYSPSATDPP